jgi:hypothetical protein
MTAKNGLEEGGKNKINLISEDMDRLKTMASIP